jgi:chloride channel 3/4/5
MYLVPTDIYQGCYGAFVSKYYLQVAAFRRKHLATHGVAEAVILACITGFIQYLNRFLRIDMTEAMSILFRECEGGGDHDGLCQASSQWSMVNSLLLATILRTGFIIVSYGTKIPAGIFVPSMAVGATFGRMVGITMKAMQQWVHVPLRCADPPGHTPTRHGLRLRALRTHHASLPELTPSSVPVQLSVVSPA